MRSREHKPFCNIDQPLWPQMGDGFPLFMITNRVHFACHGIDGSVLYKVILCWNTQIAALEYLSQDHVQILPLTHEYEAEK